MDTPICDFVRAYAERDPLRLHMPGHKGSGVLGMERLDITEVSGADSLYEAAGIIAASEANASRRFGCDTFYSTEGSSQCIRAMLRLVALYAQRRGQKPRIAAARNVHKTFLSTAALLDLDVSWLYGEGDGSYLTCSISGAKLEELLTTAAQLPTAVYLTAPDYLGDLPDLSELAQVCHRHGVLLVVDNAHGAYLRFLPQSRHPIDLGADLCCDSAHKTLSVLTGGAYLHLAPTVAGELCGWVKNALALFGSTSPSYLILQSLDAANRSLEDYPTRLRDFLPAVEECKRRLAEHGFVLYGNEPLKVTISAGPFGYTGTQLAAWLEQRDIVCEFADPDYLVLMLTPELGGEGLARLERALTALERRTPRTSVPPSAVRGERVCSIRDAMLAPWESLPIERCVGRVLASPTVGCPPAVPILVCGERIGQEAIRAFRYYGVEQCCVMLEELG